MNDSTKKSGNAAQDHENKNIDEANREGAENAAGQRSVKENMAPGEEKEMPVKPEAQRAYGDDHVLPTEKTKENRAKQEEQ
ncbi:MAG: hypothetical protein JWQ27_2184 [Ferruginibacter sp.]|nr:hypothetical protein [Ferruginibacter sp.]